MTDAPTDSTAPTRVILVNFEFPPIAGPGIWRMFALARDLANSGLEVCVVCSDRSSWHELRDATLLERLPGSVAVRRVAAPFVSDWTASLDARGARSRSALMRSAWQRAKHLVSRYAPDAAFAWIPAATRAVRDEIQASRGPVTIISSGPTHITHLAAMRARAVGRSRWIMDYRDPWTSDPKLGYPGPYQLRLFRALERRCLRSCDAVVSVAPAWIENIAEVVDDDPEVRGKLHVIRNGHDLSAQRIAELRNEARSNERLHLHFSGTLQVGTREAAQALLEGIAQLRERRHDLPLPRITFTGLHPRVQAVVDRLQLRDIIEDVGYRNQDEALRLSAAADVLLVLVDAAGPTRRGVIPGKTYEAMALGSHVLAVVPEQGDVAAILADYGQASICPEDPQAISTTLESLIEQHRRAPQSLRQRALDDAEAIGRYSRQAAAAEYMRLIGSLGGLPADRAA